MIHNIYRALHKNSAYLGTNGFQINEEKSKGENTTPETVSLTKKFKKQLKKMPKQ